MTVDTEIQMIDLILCHIFSSQNPGAGPECPHCSRLPASVASCAGAGLGDDGTDGRELRHILLSLI